MLAWELRETLMTIGGKWGSGLGEFHPIEGMAVDDQGDIYQSDLDNHRIYKYAEGVPSWQQIT